MASEIVILTPDAARSTGLRGDDGPEFAAEVVRGCPERTGSGTLYVARSSPFRNGFAESFHSKLRVGFVGREEFENEPQAQALGLLSKGEDDTERPNNSLGCKSPAEFAATCARYVPIAEGLMDNEQKD
jgi:hypothetical protein